MVMIKILGKSTQFTYNKYNTSFVQFIRYIELHITFSYLDFAIGSYSLELNYDEDSLEITRFALKQINFSKKKK